MHQIGSVRAACQKREARRLSPNRQPVRKQETLLNAERTWYRFQVLQLEDSWQNQERDGPEFFVVCWGDRKHWQFRFGRHAESPGLFARQVRPDNQTTAQRLRGRVIEEASAAETPVLQDLYCV